MNSKEINQCILLKKIYLPDFYLYRKLNSHLIFQSVILKNNFFTIINLIFSNDCFHSQKIFLLFINHHYHHLIKYLTYSSISNLLL